MSRLKTFGKYLLMFVAFYIFSTILSIGFISTTYSEMKETIYQDSNLSVKIEDAKSTFVNGYVKGTVTNINTTDIQSKYIKMEFVSKNNNEILYKYIQIDNIKAGETKNFTINFEAENIKSFNVKITDEAVREENNVHLINLADAENEEIKNISIFLAAAILLKYVIL